MGLTAITKGVTNYSREQGNDYQGVSHYLAGPFRESVKYEPMIYVASVRATGYLMFSQQREARFLIGKNPSLSVNPSYL